MTLKEKLSFIQKEMKAPKNMFNSFGKYSYRNAEGILEAFKPFEDKYKVGLIIKDDIVMIGDRIYVKASAKIFDCESAEEIEVSAFAREAVEKRGMDESQVTGATSSYARKYALNGLFLLDDTKDADTDEYQNESNGRQAKQNKKPTQKEPEHSQQAPESETISAKDAEILRNMFKEHGIREEYAAAIYKRHLVTEFTKAQCENAVKNLDKIKQMQEGNK